MGKVVAVVSLKGGVGKTTLAVNLACSWWDAYVLDLDPQGSSLAWSARARELERRRKMPEVNDLRPRRFFVGEDVEGVDIESQGGGKAFNTALARAKERTGALGLVVLDTPPHVAESAVHAAMVADLVLVPIGPSPLDFWAVEKTMDMLKLVREERSGGPTVMLIPSRLVASSGLSRDLVELLGAWGELVGPPVRQRTAYARLALEGETVGWLKGKDAARIEMETLAERVREVLR